MRAYGGHSPSVIHSFAFPWFSIFQHYTVRRAHDSFLAPLTMIISIQWFISAGTGAAFVGDTLLTVVLVNLLRKENADSKRYVSGSQSRRLC